MNSEEPKRAVVCYEDEIDLFEYVSILLKYWKRLVLAAIVGGLATYLYVVLSLPHNSSTIHIELGHDIGRAGYADGTDFRKEDLIDKAVLNEVYGKLTNLPIKTPEKFIDSFSVADVELVGSGEQPKNGEKLFDLNKYIISFSPRKNIPPEEREDILNNLVWEYSDYVVSKHPPVYNHQFVNYREAGKEWPIKSPAEYRPKLVKDIALLSTEIDKMNKELETAKYIADLSRNVNIDPNIRDFNSNIPSAKLLIDNIKTIRTVTLDLYKKELLLADYQGILSAIDYHIERGDSLDNIDIKEAAYARGLIKSKVIAHKDTKVSYKYGLIAS
ncbi:MAG: hypothetical protein KKC21_03295 [Nitrospinae bacterium]|nr:hypothetical protein [Nitrospinota bacterium]